MSAHGPVFFHGTSVEMAPGDRLVPGAVIDRDNYGLGETAHVYVMQRGIARPTGRPYRPTAPQDGSTKPRRE